MLQRHAPVSLKQEGTDTGKYTCLNPSDPYLPKRRARESRSRRRLTWVRCGACAPSAERVPLASCSSGRADSREPAAESAQTAPSSPPAKFRRLPGRRRRGPIPGSALPPTPILPPPAPPRLSDAGAVPAALGRARPGPTRGGRLHRRPSRAKGAARGVTAGELAGTGRVPGNLGRGWVGARAAPAPQAGASPRFPPQTRTDKRPTAGDPHPQPGPGEKESGVSLPGASALRSAPGPWAPPPDRRTAGQWAPGCGSGWPGRALRDRAPAGGGQLRAKPRAVSRGAALQTDKANGRQTDGGGKDGDAGGGSALLAHRSERDLLSL
ncbi:uncharacterized protein LOC111826532 [Myotis lucifugus]|uniref:uncharacterized protein LOC111826532 n=1 Tax=Myotis lucifugus TaxID=59463 RepID=UPI000CCC8C3B|nr:uncharacterized protein LOC111826532 [Myotis lucifugus]